MELKEIKQQFYAFRNGIVADALRKAGDGHQVIFGLNLPQLIQVAQTTGCDRALAEQLWANATTRESRLLAPMVYPRADFAESTAVEWVRGVENTEVADVLCHKLLRYEDYAERLYISLCGSESDMTRYVALRLALNLSIQGRIADVGALHAAAVEEQGRDCPLTAHLAASILEDFGD